VKFEGHRFLDKIPVARHIFCQKKSFNAIKGFQTTIQESKYYGNPHKKLEVQKYSVGSLKV
jgi:hypothetical protein